MAPELGPVQAVSCLVGDGDVEFLGWASDGAAVPPQMVPPPRDSCCGRGCGGWIREESAAVPALGFPRAASGLGVDSGVKPLGYIKDDAVVLGRTLPPSCGDGRVLFAGILRGA